MLSDWFFTQHGQLGKYINKKGLSTEGCGWTQSRQKSHSGSAGKIFLTINAFYEKELQLKGENDGRNFQKSFWPMRDLI